MGVIGFIKGYNGGGCDVIFTKWRKIMHSFLFLIAGLSLIALPGDLPGGSQKTQANQQESIQMNVRGITIDQKTQQPVVLLVDLDGKRALPIWIGTAEARAIAMELEGLSTPRPMTHELILNILKELRADIEKITITELKDNTYFALLSLKGKKGNVLVDSRPSDAIALALKVKAPIYVTNAVLDAARLINLTAELPQEKWEEKYGFHIQELTPELAEYFQMAKKQGVLIIDVKKGSPGAKAGLRQGDIITAVGDSPVSNLEGLSSSLSKQKKAFTLTVLREGQTLSLPFTP